MFIVIQKRDNFYPAMISETCCVFILGAYLQGLSFKEIEALWTIDYGPFVIKNIGKN